MTIGIVSTFSLKGGVGKTTSAVNIATYLAVTETPTLLIDMDPQANATSGLGIEVGSYKKSIYDIIITIDSDLQDDPSEIPKLLNKIDEGWVGIFTNYGFSSISFFFGHIFFYGNADSLIFYVRG